MNREYPGNVVIIVLMSFVASTKGAALLFTTSEFEYRSRAAGASPFVVCQDLV